MKDAQTVGCCNGVKMATSLPVSAWPNSIYGSALKALLSPPNLALPRLGPFLPHVLYSACLFPSFLCVDCSSLLSGACIVHPFVLFFPSWIVCTQFLFTILRGFECRLTAWVSRGFLCLMTHTGVKMYNTHWPGWVLYCKLLKQYHSSSSWMSHCNVFY